MCGEICKISIETCYTRKYRRGESVREGKQAGRKVGRAEGIREGGREREKENSAVEAF